jgi:hypothetical protein
MACEIDTGIEDRNSLEYAVKTFIADWFLDMSHGLGNAKIMRAYSEQVISEIDKPVKLDTARKHMIAHWQFLKALAEHDPAAFDHVILSYADRVG